MSTRPKICSLFFYLVVLSMLTIRPAYAYLDPGAGSLFLQSALAVIALLVIALKVYWHKILVLLGIRGGNHVPKNKSDEKIQSIKNEPS